MISSAVSGWRPAALPDQCPISSGPCPDRDRPGTDGATNKKSSSMAQTTSFHTCGPCSDHDLVRTPIRELLKQGPGQSIRSDIWIRREFSLVDSQAYSCLKRSMGSIEKMNRPLIPLIRQGIPESMVSRYRRYRPCGGRRRPKVSLIGPAGASVASGQRGFSPMVRPRPSEHAARAHSPSRRGGTAGSFNHRAISPRTCLVRKLQGIA